MSQYQQQVLFILMFLGNTSIVLGCNLCVIDAHILAGKDMFFVEVNHEFLFWLWITKHN